MFEVVIVSPLFQDKRTLARHRLVNDTLKDEISKVHAFSQVRSILFLVSSSPSLLMTDNRNSTRNPIRLRNGLNTRHKPFVSIEITSLSVIFFDVWCALVSTVLSLQVSAHKVHAQQFLGDSYDGSARVLEYVAHINIIVQLHAATGSKSAYAYVVENDNCMQYGIICMSNFSGRIDT